MNIDEIKRLIPHRYPFLLVDRVIDYQEDTSITTIKNVTANEPFFNGHFPIKPVMPGVLMVEAMAQTAGLLMAKMLDWQPNHDHVCYLAGVNNARFKRVVEPGDQLQLVVEYAAHRLTVWKFSGKVLVEGKVACSADITLAS